MKTLYTAYRILIISLLFISAKSFSQTPTYQLRIANESQPGSRTYEFEVFLLNTSQFPFELQYMSFGLGWDTTILNGGTQGYSIVTNVNGDPLLPALSELKPSQVPFSLPSGGTLAYTVSTHPGVFYRYFNCAARTPPGVSNGTIISTVDGGCTHPGTRIARFRLTSTIPFRDLSTCKHIWSTNVGANKTNTIIQAYVPAGLGQAVNITDHTSNVDYDDQETCITPPDGIILHTLIGIEDVERPLDYLLYPNPANESVHIDFGNNYKWAKIEMSNALGEMVREVALANTAGMKESFDLSAIARGVYFVRVTTDEGYDVRKLVVE